MYLTDQEKKMLQGEYGAPVQKAMEILVHLGDFYGAEKMIAVRNVHMPGSSAIVAGKAGIRFVELMGNEGGLFCTLTTLNTAAVDLLDWRDLGFPEQYYHDQARLTRAYKKMGGVGCHTCIPYLSGNLPRFGEHIAWGESSAIAFVNSVVGARTNREGGPSALAAALTGRVPLYGYHLDENRAGQVRINVTAKLKGAFDYGTLGYYVGKQCQELIPVFTGLPSNITIDELKMLSAALASSGSVALFHVVGITPEAPTLEAAFRGKAALMEIEFGRTEYESTIAQLNKSRTNRVDLVVIGCPHASIDEIKLIAENLYENKTNSAVDFWITTAIGNKEIASRNGYLEIIEKAGARLVCDTCPILGPTAAMIGTKGYNAIATNSAKLAHYIPGQWDIGSHYGSFEQCIKAAITGVWGDEK